VDVLSPSSAVRKQQRDVVAGVSHFKFRSSILRGQPFLYLIILLFRRIMNKVRSKSLLGISSSIPSWRPVQSQEGAVGMICSNANCGRETKKSPQEARVRLESSAHMVLVAAAQRGASKSGRCCPGDRERQRAREEITARLRYPERTTAFPHPDPHNPQPCCLDTVARWLPPTPIAQEHAAWRLRKNFNVIY